MLLPILSPSADDRDAPRNRLQLPLASTTYLPQRLENPFLTKTPVPLLSLLWSVKPVGGRLAVLLFGVALVVGGGILRRRKKQQKFKLAEPVDHNSGLASFDLESIGRAAAPRPTAKLALLTREAPHSIAEQINNPKETI
jgi:hypothetical protein